ncbi:MAG: asparagine synthase (glutamine-hydrolyzing) [Candidatus Paceibacterota bacterium]
MCSINGITWEDAELVRKMNQVTNHRGPDGTAVRVLSGATFGHNRLAIIDLDPRASQPMQVSGGRYTIMFNGEIYNYRELKKELRYEWRTESDTEVILAGFEQWGRGVFERLNGMYALAIHDRDTGVITFARDPMGIKPLYIARTPKGYAFSSEIKALLETGVSRVLNREAFNAYMRTLYVPASLTLFEGVEKFPPGHIGTIQNGALSIEPFTYSPEASPLDSNDSQGLREAVQKAVVRQMVSDRPIGVYLSGGVDSSSILAAATEAGGSMNTYSIGFELDEEEEPEKFNADSVLAKRIAAHFGAQHHEFFIAPKDVLNLFEQAVYHLDEPIGNATIAAQLALSRKARESVVVALTGDGGDEIFGGYPRYLMSRRMDAYQSLVPSFVSNILPFSQAKKMGTRSLEERFALFHYQKDQSLKGILTELPSALSLEHVKTAKNIMEADRKTWLVDEALLRSDKLGMAHGLETRPPLLDLELVHQMSAIPFEKQVSLFNTKVLLKQAFKSDLPEWVIHQPKRGWFSPGAKWLRHRALQQSLDEILAPGYAPNTDSLFNWDGVRSMFVEHKEKRAYHATALMSVLMFQIWSKQFNVSL